MKVTVALVVVACCVLGLFSGQSEAVKCYVCTSLTGGGCADPFKADSTITTKDSCAICGKTKGAQSGVQVVARTCETSSTGMSAGCQSASQGGASADLCYCTSDLCNASTRASITTALLFLMPALLLCFKKL